MHCSNGKTFLRVTGAVGSPKNQIIQKKGSAKGKGIRESWGAQVKKDTRRGGWCWGGGGSAYQPGVPQAPLVVEAPLHAHEDPARQGAGGAQEEGLRELQRPLSTGDLNWGGGAGGLNEFTVCPPKRTQPAGKWLRTIRRA